MNEENLFRNFTSEQEVKCRSAAIEVLQNSSNDKTQMMVILQDYENWILEVGKKENKDVNVSAYQKSDSWLLHVKPETEHEGGWKVDKESDVHVAFTESKVGQFPKSKQELLGDIRKSNLFENSKISPISDKDFVSGMSNEEYAHYTKSRIIFLLNGYKGDDPQVSHVSKFELENNVEQGMSM